MIGGLFWNNWDGKRQWIKELFDVVAWSVHRCWTVPWVLCLNICYLLTRQCCVRVYERGTRGTNARVKFKGS